MKLRDRVGQNIQDLRRSLGISQEDLALRARINRGYMGKVENGKYSVSLDILEKIALVLKVEACVLLSTRKRDHPVFGCREGCGHLDQQSKPQFAFGRQTPKEGHFSTKTSTKSRHQGLVSALSRGIIVPTLAPFGEDGHILKHAISDQTRRLAEIDAIIGMAVNAAPRKRNALTTAERADVIRETRAGLGPDQLLFAHVGELGDESHDDVVACKATGPAQ